MRLIQRAFTPSELRQFCSSLLMGAGVLPEQAQIVAHVLVDTSLDGIDTHGISRLPIYLTRLKNTRIKARPEITVTKTAPATAVLDGDNGLGQLVAVRAMEEAMKLAETAGIGAVSVKHSNHFGAATYYCKMAALNGMIGMALTNSPAGIPPWGGKKPYFGTNPISCGFPTEDLPVIIDLSSSNVARGNIILAAKEGRAIPEGWAIDGEGKPTTDAQKALAGAVLPLGGAKGYALALLVEIFSGVISGAAFGHHVGWIYDDSLEPTDVGQFMLAFNIEKFMPLADFLSRGEQMKSEIRSVPLAEGFDRILLPGERKQEKAKNRQASGIPVSTGLLEELNQLAATLGVAPLEP